MQDLRSDLHLLSSVATLPVEHLLMGPAVCVEPCAFAAKLAAPPHSSHPSKSHAGESPAPAWDKPHHPLQPHLPIGCLLETWAR